MDAGQSPSKRLTLYGGRAADLECYRGIMKARRNILVVDDEPCVRDIYLQFLSLSGYEVVASGSGEEALEAVARQPYDLMILDLCLTGMDGLATFSRVKTISPDTKAVVVSASLDRFESELRHAQKNGLAGVLAKPFALQDLSALVESAFDSGMCAASLRVPITPHADRIRQV